MIKRISLALAMACALSLSASAQTLTTITGTIKNNDGSLVTSGQVAFTLQPGIDSSMSGVARFSSSEVDCLINGSGLIKAQDGVSACTLLQNTSITPSGTNWKACIQNQFVQPGSCFYFYTFGTTMDLTTQVPTPPGVPAYNLVDTFSNQTVAGAKTFTGTITFGGPLSLQSLTLGGNETIAGTLAVSGATTLASTTVGSASTLFVNNIKQQAGASFLIADPNGVSHFFISNGAPYTNSFVNGNGSGVVFLGSAAKTSVADTTGNIVTAGNIALQTTSGTLPATIVNDTLGGLLFTTNAGKGWQMANSTGQLQGFAGVTILLQGATSGGVALAVPSVAGSNTLTLPAATDTLVGKATTDTLTNKTLSSPIINGGVANNGSGFQHKRGVTGCTTAASLNAVCSTTITWNTAFADANYTVVGCVGNGIGAGIPVLQAFGSKVAASISVQTLAITAAAAQFSTIECTAVHD